MTERETVFWRIVGRRIRELRLKRSMGQLALASRIGISDSTISFIESGQHRCSAFRLCQIADALTMPVSEILTLEARTALRGEPISTTA